MPQDHNWALRAPSFNFKPQDYTNSCFSACLQMALVSFSLLPSLGRTTEDEFNEYMLHHDFPNLDAAAPNRDSIMNFLLIENFTGKERVGINIIDVINEEIFNHIRQEMNRFPHCAIIGALNDAGGHALALIKKDGSYYGVNPAGGIEDITVSHNNPIQLLEGDGHQAIGTPVGAMEFCYLIHRQL